jgi:hypothetical protein
MAVRSSPSRFKTGNPSLRPNNARSAKPRTNTCTTTTARNVRSYAARSARRSFKPIIVIKERLKPNITARIATARYSAGKSASTSSFTNAATITARTALTRSNNSTRQNKIFDDQNLPNSNSATFTANIYSKPKISSSRHRSNQPSTYARSTIHPTSSD